MRAAYAGGMLVYDADCGLCVRSLGWARRLGAECDAVAWQEADLDELGLSEQDVVDAAWFVTDHERFRGHEAVALTLQSSRHVPMRLLGRVVGSRLLRPVASRAYAWVAGNRHRLPGSSDACRIDPTE